MIGNLLVIDDDEVNCDVLTRRLERQGHQVTVAYNGRDGLQLLRARPFDLVLLDIMMPDLNGYQVLEAIKSDPLLRELPVIMITAVSDIESVVQCIEMGAEDYLFKPFNPVLLKARINASLEKKQLRDRQDDYLATMERLAADLQYVILPLGIALSEEKNFDRLLERILLQSKVLCNADACTLYLRGDNNELRFAMLHTDSLHLSLGGTTGEPIPYAPLSLYTSSGEPNVANLATHVALNGHSVNVPDLYQSDAFDFSSTREFDRSNSYRSVSSLTVPLKNDTGSVIGVLQLLNAQDDRGKVVPFSSYHQLVVESLASQAAVALNNRMLLKRQEVLVKLEHDVQVGRQIQASFLPDHMPEIPGFEIAARFEPAREVAGDFYDAFYLTSSRLCFVIADVCDKGVGAALYMALVRSLIRAYAQHQYRLDPVALPQPDARPRDARDADVTTGTVMMRNAVTLANQYLTSNHLQTNMFATLFFGVLDPASGFVTYINGGHNPPMIIGPEGIKARLKPTGPAVGMMPGMDFRIRYTQLDPGDFLLCYTDGVTDARNPAGKLFGEARLIELALQRAPSALALVDGIQDRLRAHIADAAQFDDITMLALRRAE